MMLAGAKGWLAPSAQKRLFVGHSGLTRLVERQWSK